MKLNFIKRELETWDRLVEYHKEQSRYKGELAIRYLKDYNEEIKKRYSIETRMKP